MTNIRSGEIDVYKELINRFDELPEIPKPTPTIFEISGYPHYEDVISNVLKFFLSNDQGHNFSPIFIEALLDASGKNKPNYTPTDFEVSWVEREVSTFENNRIDLVIKTDTLCIVIENKIYHYLNNDLTDYQEYVDKNYESEASIFLILSLRDLEIPKEVGTTDFVLLTYESFLDALETRIGKEFSSANNRFLVYLSDFIKTLRNMNKKTQLSDEFLNYLSEYKTEIESLYQQAFKDFKNEIRHKAEEIDHLMEEVDSDYVSFHLPKSDHLEYVQGYKKSFYLNSEKVELQIKLRLNPKEYTLELWTEGKANSKHLSKFLAKKLSETYPHIKEHDENSMGNVLTPFEYGEEPEEIVDELKKIMKILDTI